MQLRIDVSFPFLHFQGFFIIWIGNFVCYQNKVKPICILYMQKEAIK